LKYGKERESWLLVYPVLPSVRKSIVLFEGSQASPGCPGKSSIKMTMSVEHLWNGTDWGTEVLGEECVGA
jgi:hypothetical protein